MAKATKQVHVCDAYTIWKEGALTCPSGHFMTRRNTTLAAYNALGFDMASSKRLRFVLGQSSEILATSVFLSRGECQSQVGERRGIRRPKTGICSGRIDVDAAGSQLVDIGILDLNRGFVMTLGNLQL